ncbi:bifunctional diguanylate cyclase/phosphodiesterase [Palleronia sp. LCG004]|uniref:putative bifunctional diguanylate cyclase/phosphodiesterase n=1 Tax=Palleronia sp. LCG004 TaxID=3079304 RepID=UPI0029429D40|nr:bifunctional diguanylate cyclase/phosphodiesterase [Palleronia sp. LCG004]WOI58285.1 bifunctional diguanylate cyclase/phosphodiesterase [Palleronia sp. LCG004]
MRRTSLHRQIVLLAVILVTAFCVVLWFSILSIRAAMDRQAESESLDLMRGRMGAFQEQVALIASDYHNWTDVFDAATTLDYAELYSNYGITAVRADVFQYAEMFDGPFEDPIAWVAGSTREPIEGFLSRETRDALRRDVPNLDFQGRETLDFYEFRSDRLVLFSASWLLPEDTFIVPTTMDGQLAIAVIGKILSSEQLARVETELDVTNLQINAPDAATGLVRLPLEDAVGNTIAVLSWTPPAPGTVLLQRILPIMIGVTLAFICIAFWAARQLLDRAAQLARKEAEAARLARTDPLTQLPNRLALREHLAGFTGSETTQFVAFCLDVDRFKHTNDVVGHAGGDTYLTEIAHRIETLADETTFVARHGGSEFFVVISGSNDFDAAVSIKTAAIHRLCIGKIVVSGYAFEMSLSKGLAYSEPREQAYEEVLMRADRAMNLAKSRRTPDVVRYDAEMQAQDAFDTAVEKAFRFALDSGTEFQLYYQPIVSGIGTGEVVRFEALARWDSPSLGRISPADFIRIAESSGLILPLGKLLLQRACDDLAANPGMSISLNVSPVQLMTPGFVESLLDEVEARQIDPKRIEIEVTENVVIFNNSSVSAALHELRSRGFSIALDDFGTGFSSIGYLAGMPFNVLKIDRSFISGQAAGERTMTMARSMVGLAHSLDMAVVAEGVETEEDAYRCRSFGCDMLQGYYFGRPKPLDLISNFAQLEFDFDSPRRNGQARMHPREAVHA